MSATANIPGPVIVTVGHALEQLRQIALERASCERLGIEESAQSDLNARVAAQYSVLAWFAECCSGQGIDPEAALLDIRATITRGTPTPILRTLLAASRCATPATGAGRQARADEIAEIVAELERRGEQTLSS